MTKLELLTVLYSLDELMSNSDLEATKKLESMQRIITRIINEAENKPGKPSTED